jgi:hypothetical protein
MVRHMARWLAATVALTSALLCMPVQAQGSPEYKLAVLQTGSYVAPDDDLVGQFGSALDVLGAECQEPRDRLGDIAVLIHDRMQARGIDESYLSILQNVGMAVPAEAQLPMRCTEVFAAYFVARVDG